MNSDLLSTICCTEASQIGPPSPTEARRLCPARLFSPAYRAALAVGPCVAAFSYIEAHLVRGGVTVSAPQAFIQVAENV